MSRQYAAAGRTAGYAAILSAAALWGLLGPIARVVLEDGTGPIELGFWRAAIAGGLFAGHAWLTARRRIARRDLPSVGAFAILGVSVLYGAYFLAVQAGGAALAAVLLYTAPAWVALGAWAWLNERPTARTAGALAISLVGVAAVALGAGGPVRVTPAALFWGLLSGLAYASYYLFGKRYFDRYGAPTMFAYALPIGAAVLVPVVDFQPKDGVAWAAILLIALLPTYAAYLLYAYGLARISATRAATAATIEPVVAALVAYFVWGESLGWAGYAGAIVVLAGVLMMTTGGADEQMPDARRDDAT